MEREGGRDGRRTYPFPPWQTSSVRRTEVFPLPPLIRTQLSSLLPPLSCLQKFKGDFSVKGKVKRKERRPSWDNDDDVKLGNNRRGGTKNPSILFPRLLHLPLFPLLHLLLSSLPRLFIAETLISAASSLPFSLPPSNVRSRFIVLRWRKEEGGREKAKIPTLRD